MVVFVVKRYAVREAEKWQNAVRKAKKGRYAVRKGGRGCHPHEGYLSSTHWVLLSNTKYKYCVYFTCNN